MPTGWQAYRPSSDEVPYVKWRHARSPLALERAHYPLSRNSKTYRGGSQSSPNNPLAQGARTAFAGEEGRARRTKSISPVSISGETPTLRSEEHTSELQSLMRNSYAVFCLKKKIQPKPTN